MSRAFTKETAESAAPPERMVDEGPNLVTPEGRGTTRAARERVQWTRERSERREPKRAAGQSIATWVVRTLSLRTPSRRIHDASFAGDDKWS